MIHTKAVELSYAQIIDEIDALEKMIERMNDSMARSGDWLAGQMGPEGPIANEPSVSWNHKVCWGLYEEGRINEVIQILDFVVGKARRAPAEYYFAEEEWYEKDMQRIYRFCTLAKFAEYLRYEKIANDEDRARAFEYQHESGGVFANIDEDPAEELEPLNTSFFGQWALAGNMIDRARRAAEWLAEMVGLNEKHLSQEPPCIYYKRRASDGSLVTEFPNDHEMNYAIRADKIKQPSWVSGTSMALLADVYRVTGEEVFLDAALKLADYEARCDPAQVFWPAKCKVAWGLGQLYAVTHNPEHRRLCANVNRITFMESQLPRGGWAKMFYPLEEKGAWREVVYAGPERHVPESLREDGTWLFLREQEVSGEFMGEMGRSRAAFQEVLAEFRRQKADYEARLELGK